jgi:hypothetical protein
MHKQATSCDSVGCKEAEVSKVALTAQSYVEMIPVTWGSHLIAVCTVGPRSDLRRETCSTARLAWVVAHQAALSSCLRTIRRCHDCCDDAPCRVTAGGEPFASSLCDRVRHTALLEARSDRTALRKAHGRVRGRRACWADTAELLESKCALDSPRNTAPLTRRTAAKV